MKDYVTRYQSWSRFLKEHPALLAGVLFGNRWISRIMYVLYPALLVYVLVVGYPNWWTFLLIPALGFVLLSLFREALNAPRPYEKENMIPILTKETSGQSFPSRHVFSATMISMCLLQVFPTLGLACLILAALLAVCRVLLGVHYPRDVVVGYLLGIGFGLLLYVF